jgi:hypothetical protein
MCWSAAVSEPTERLVGTDTAISAITKLSERNPGALRVCFEILKDGAAIDPQGINGFGTLLSIDSLHIYGSRIWLLYKDICGESLVMMMACVRGWQLGIVNQKDLIRAIDNAESGNRAHSLDLPAILSAVKKRIGNFGNQDVPEPSPNPVGPHRFIDLD